MVLHPSTLPVDNEGSILFIQSQKKKKGEVCLFGYWDATLLLEETPFSCITQIQSRVRNVPHSPDSPHPLHTPEGTSRRYAPGAVGRRGRLCEMEAGLTMDGLTLGHCLDRCRTTAEGGPRGRRRSGGGVMLLKSMILTHTLDFICCNELAPQRPPCRRNTQPSHTLFFPNKQQERENKKTKKLAQKKVQTVEKKLSLCGLSTETRSKIRPEL